MIIGIDFDETLTLDAKLWRGFVDLAIGLGHRVICVTSRRRTYENMETISQWMVSHRTIRRRAHWGISMNKDLAKEIELRL